MALFDSLISPLLTSVQGLISQFHLSPEDAQKAKQALADAQAKAVADAQAYELQLATVDAQENATAGQNIRSETGSTDKFTARARPTFLYIVNAILGFNFIILPVLKAVGLKAEVINIPTDVLTLFGVVMTGYVVSRSVDKALALPGDSSVNVMGLVKLGNKS